MLCAFTQWAKLMKKIQPAVRTFLAVAIPFVVQGDWTVAFCRPLFFSPKCQSNRTKLNYINATGFWIKLKHIVLSSAYVPYFNLKFVFLCFLFFVFPSFFLFEFWSKSKLILDPILHFICEFCLICPFFFLRFLFSFPSFFLLFFQLSFLLHLIMKIIS